MASCACTHGGITEKSHSLSWLLQSKSWVLSVWVLPFFPKTSTVHLFLQDLTLKEPPYRFVYMNTQMTVRML